MINMEVLVSGMGAVEAKSLYEESSVMPNITNMTRLNIIEDSCLYNLNTVTCIRTGILSGLAGLTAIFCIFKLVRLHIARHPSCHQYVIFYAAALECVTGGIHWVFWNVTQLDFLLQYLKILQVLIMSHYYVTLAIRALRKENMADRFLYPFLCITALYFSVITSLGIINAGNSFNDCMAPYWLALSAAEVILVQVFVVSGFYITRRLNEISTLDSVRWAQKRDLWCIVVVFQLSAVVTFMYDLLLQLVGNQETGCSAIFSYLQTVYSPTLVTLMVLKLLLPIWVMLFVFQPHGATTEDHDILPAYSDDGTYGSIFSEEQAYRQLYQPTDSPCSPGCEPVMQDASLPFGYTNPALTSIAEEMNNGGDNRAIPMQNTPPSRDDSPARERTKSQPIRTQNSHHYQRGRASRIKQSPV